MQDVLTASADKSAGTEKKLAKLHGGYIERQKKLRAKIAEVADSLERTKVDVGVQREVQVQEEAAMRERLEGLRHEVGFVRKREREAQEEYRVAKDELEAL